MLKLNKENVSVKVGTILLVLIVVILFVKNATKIVKSAKEENRTIVLNVEIMGI